MGFWDKISGKDKGKYILSLDVGTEVVKALVSYIDYDDGKVINLGMGKVRQEKGNIFGGKILDHSGVIKSCKRAIKIATKNSDIYPKEVILGFSGSTVRIQTDFFSFNRKNPDSRIDSAELRRIVQEAYEFSVSQINIKLSAKEKQEGIRLVSSDIADFMIDGYRIINPLNFKGSNIKIGVSSSFVLSSDFDLIQKIVDDLDLKLFKVAYGPYAVLKAIGGGDILGFNAIMVDIGGNITDVAIIKNGNIQKAGMFAIGGRMFTKRIAHNFDLNEEQAEDLKIKYSEGHIENSDSDKIREMLKDDIRLWKSGVELSLDSYSKSQSLLPSRFLVFGGGSQLTNLVGSLNDLSGESFSFSGKMKLDFVSLEDIPDNVNKISSMNDFQDVTPVCLSHLCFDNPDEEDVPNRILEEIILN